MKPKLYLINGPLGAGKTTFLKELLQLPAYKDARIIENEFANTSVDTDQLHDHHAEVQTIAGVCICCSTGDELTNALASLSHDSAPVIIEATGVANSLKLIEKIVVADMLEKYDLAHAIFIIDAAEAAHDIETTIQTYSNELKAADTVLVSKTDLISPSSAEHLMEALHGLQITRIGLVYDGVFDHSLLDNPSQILAYFAELDDKLTNHDGGTNYTILDLEDTRIAIEVIDTIWNDLQKEYGLRRLKGDIYDQNGHIWHIEATPAQCRVTKSMAHKAKLVFIGSNARAITKSVIESAARNYHG